MKTSSYKKFLAAGMGVLMTTALAHPAHAQQTGDDTMLDDPMTGVYFGGFGGFGWTEAEVAGPDFDVDTRDFGLFIGAEVGRLLDRAMGIGLQGGLEFHYAWSTNGDDTIGATTLDKSNEWGITFRPGLTVISDMMPMNLKPYGIFGYRRAEYEITTAGATTEEDYNGFDLGIGTELVAFNDFWRRGNEEGKH